MKRVVVSLVCLLAAFAIYTSIFSATVRYRLTLEAEVDGEPKTGSGVVEVSYSKNNDPISSAEFTVGIRGEAVALNLGPRGILFALLKEDSDARSGPEYIVLRAFNFPGGALPSPVTNGLSQVKRLSGKVALPLTSLPLLVRFRDLDDPKSIEKVDPLDIATSFGAGAKLVGVTLEIVPAGIWPLSWCGITGEPITRGLSSKLKWLPEYYDRHLDGETTETISSQLRLANSLASGAFKTGR
jgi:hypothetical protein